MALVERDQQLDDLTAVLAGACATDGGGVGWSRARPGIGKSSLVRAFADRSAERCLAGVLRAAHDAASPAAAP